MHTDALYLLGGGKNKNQSVISSMKSIRTGSVEDRKHGGIGCRTKVRFFFIKSPRFWPNDVHLTETAQPNPLG